MKSKYSIPGDGHVCVDEECFRSHLKIPLEDFVAGGGITVGVANVTPDQFWLRFDTGLQAPIVDALTPIRKVIDRAVSDVAELRALDAMIAATKARLLALAETAQRIHDQHDAISTVCPLAQDLLAAAAKL